MGTGPILVADDEGTTGMTPEETFALFYSEYARHEARKDGLKAWLKLNPDEDLFAVILKDVLLRKRTIWLGKESQYIPLPASYIRGERWTDEINYEQFTESKSDAIARQNREAGEAVRESFRGTVGGGLGYDSE